MSDKAVWQRLEALKIELRDPGRVKEGIDYAVVVKYGVLHLLCDNVYLPRILETAEKFSVTFATVHTYR